MSAAEGDLSFVDDATEPDGFEDHAYFLAIEDHFVRLRGAPLLLSPADWHAARRWHQQGIPLELVRRAPRQVFARPPPRRAQSRNSRPRYCSPPREGPHGPNPR